MTYPVQEEQVVVGASTGLAGAQVDDGVRQRLYESDIAPDFSTIPAPAVVRVQNGSATLGAAAIRVDVTIPTVVMSQSFLTFGASFDDANPGVSQVSGQIFNGTTLRFERITTGTAISLKWYVAEFAAGVSVQRGSGTMSGAVLDIPIAATNLARSFPLISCRIGGTAYAENDFHRAKLTSSTNLQITVNAGTGGICEWQVVDYVAASVQSGDLSFSNGAMSSTATVAAVNTSKSWLLFTYASAPGTGANIGQKMVRGVVTNPTTLTFDRGSNGQTIDLTWYLVEFTDATIVQSGSAPFTSGQTQLDVPIVCVDTLTTLASAGALSYRGGSTPYAADDNPGVSSVTLDLNSATNLRLTRGLTGSVTATIGWFVVRFAGYIGCRIEGAYPTDIASEDGTFIRYREGLYTNYRLDLRYDWSGVPVGDGYELRVTGYRTNEDVLVQVLTPPVTWNTGITVNSVANQVFTYTMTAAEYNGGSPAIRFLDSVPSPDASASDLFLDGVAVITLNFAFSLDVRQNITGIVPQPGPVLVIKGNITGGGENFDVHAWNFTSSAWDLLMAAPFTASNAYHNVSLAADYLSGGSVRLRYLDAGSQDTIGSALSLDLVAVAINDDQSMLTNDGASPASGDLTTSFTFFVRYSDAENNAPAFVNLTLASVGYPLSENNSADTNYVDGKDYFFVRLIGTRGTFDYSFSTRASAGDTSISTTPVRQVSVLNRLPTITNGAPADSVHTGRVYARDFNGTDPDNDTLAWSLSTNASWLSIGPANGTIWGVAPAAASAFYADVVAADGFGGSDSNNLTLSVTNGGPTITNAIGSDGVHASRPYVRDFNGTDPEGDPLAWSLTTNASWLSLGPANGTVWGVAPPAIGAYYVNIGLVDGYGGSASDNYTLSVGNLAPSITNPIVSDGVHNGRPYVRDFNGTDPEGDPLAWSMSTNATWLSLGAMNGTVWGLAPATPGAFYVNVGLSDGLGGSTSNNYSLSVGNLVPSISNPLGSVSVFRRVSAAVDFNASDLDGDALLWSLRSNATFLSVGAVNGTVTGLTPNVPSTYWVEVTVADGFGGTDVVNFTLRVVNRAPQASVTAPGTAAENDTYQGTFSGTDPDGDALSWTASTNAPWLVIDTGALTLSGRAVPGVYFVNLTARDPYGGVAYRNFTITVTAGGPQPPPQGFPLEPFIVVGGLATIILGVAALAILAVPVAARRRPRSLEQAFLLDPYGAVRVRYDASGPVFDEPALVGLLEARDWRSVAMFPAKPHVLHIVHRPEGDWVLVSRTDAVDPLLKEAQPLFAAAERDWPPAPPPEELPEASAPEP